MGGGSRRLKDNMRLTRCFKNVGGHFVPASVTEVRESLGSQEKKGREEWGRVGKKSPTGDAKF